MFQLMKLFVPLYQNVDKNRDVTELDMPRRTFTLITILLVNGGVWCVPNP